MKKSIIFLFSLLFSLTVKPQIVNKGMAYLSPETKFVALYDFDNQEGGEFYNDGKASFYKNFNNDGVFDFYEDTGKTLFVGQTIQELNGLNPSHFYQLIFDNNAQMIPFLLSGDFNIHHSANFMLGIVDNRSFGGKLLFKNSAEAINPWDESYVQGPVEKSGAADFIYPVGDEGYYRFAGTSNTGSVNHFETAYFYANSDAEYPHSQKQAAILSINNREYWTIENLEGSADQLFVTLSYHNMATPQEFITAATQNALVIIRWDVATSQWVNEAGSIDLNDKSITTATDKLGIFTLARVEAEDEEEACDVEVFNLVDISGSSDNKFMRFQSDCAEDFAVKVFNRWGVKVFETENYGLQGDVFDGFSGGRMTLGDKDHLPTGTYFYIVNYRYDNGVTQKLKQEVGYVYVRSN